MRERERGRDSITYFLFRVTHTKRYLFLPLLSAPLPIVSIAVASSLVFFLDGFLYIHIYGICIYICVYILLLYIYNAV